MLNFFKRLVPKSIKEPIKQYMGFQSMENRLRNLRHAGFYCTGALDVGAHHGEWTKSLRRIFEVPVILFEPQPQCKPILESYVNESGNATARTYLESCALGRESGVVQFILQETNSRVLQPNDEKPVDPIKVPMQSLRDILPRYTEKFNLLKLDVQGFELEVLDGGFELLQQFEVIILETSVIRIGDVPTFYEVMQYMHARDYRLYDFLPMYYRPLDGALWQGDAFFVKNNSSLVSSLTWA